MLATTVTTRARRFLMVLGTLGLAAAVWAPAPVGAKQSPPSAVDATIFSATAFRASSALSVV